MNEIALERLDFLQERCDDRSVVDVMMLPKDEIQKLIDIARQALSQGDVVWDGECLLYGRSMAEVNLLTSIHNLFPDRLDDCEKVHVTIRRAQ